MEKVTIFDVANYFINENYDPSSDSFITPLKLQKMCYYAQAYYLAVYGEKMFEEDFEAWVHGPANLELYNKYKDCGMGIIEPKEKNYKFNNNELSILDYTQIEYGKYDGKFLETLTHQEEPWKNARKGYRNSEKCKIIIKKEDIIKFYLKIVNKDKIENYNYLRQNEENLLFLKINDIKFYYDKAKIRITKEIENELSQFVPYEDETSYSFYIEDGELIVF